MASVLLTASDFDENPFEEKKNHPSPAPLCCANNKIWEHFSAIWSIIQRKYMT
jgi:hypothetical protein